MEPINDLSNILRPILFIDMSNLRIFYFPNLNLFPMSFIYDL